MEGIEGEHAEYADDNCVWENGEILVEEIVKMNKGLKTGLKWSRMWSMLIAPEKTEVIIFTPGNEIVRPEEKKVECDGKILKTVKSKMILGIIVDDRLSFHEHIANKTKFAFSAIRGFDEFVQGQRGCSNDIDEPAHRHILADASAIIYVRRTSKINFLRFLFPSVYHLHVYTHERYNHSRQFLCKFMTS